jgi:hypothetical protein
MAELVVLYFLCKKISAIARGRGKDPTNYCVLLIGLWIGGEIAGGIVGVVLTGYVNLVTYFFALVGAVVGSSIAFKRVNRRSLDYPFNPPKKDGV